MKVICAWCGADKGEKEPLDDKRVTHGICEDCYKKEMSKLKTFQEKNCIGCRFADYDKVGTGEPCCTYWQQIATENGVCLTRKPERPPSKREK